MDLACSDCSARGMASDWLLSLLLGTAVYGSVRTVVWKDGMGSNPMPPIRFNEEPVLQWFCSCSRPGVGQNRCEGTCDIGVECNPRGDGGLPAHNAHSSDRTRAQPEPLALWRRRRRLSRFSSNSRGAMLPARRFSSDCSDVFLPVWVVATLSIEAVDGSIQMVDSR